MKKPLSQGKTEAPSKAALTERIPTVIPISQSGQARLGEVNPPAKVTALAGAEGRPRRLPAPPLGGGERRRARGAAPHARPAAASLARPPRRLALSALTRATGRGDGELAAAAISLRGRSPQLAPVTAATSAPSGRARPRENSGKVGGGAERRERRAGGGGAPAAPRPLGPRRPRGS